MLLVFGVMVRAQHPCGYQVQVLDGEWLILRERASGRVEQDAVTCETLQTQAVKKKSLAHPPPATPCVPLWCPQASFRREECCWNRRGNGAQEQRQGPHAYPNPANNFVDRLIEGYFVKDYREGVSLHAHREATHFP